MTATRKPFARLALAACGVMCQSMGNAAGASNATATAPPETATAKTAGDKRSIDELEGGDERPESKVPAKKKKLWRFFPGDEALLGPRGASGDSDEKAPAMNNPEDPAYWVEDAFLLRPVSRRASDPYELTTQHLIKELEGYVDLLERSARYKANLGKWASKKNINASKDNAALLANTEDGICSCKAGFENYTVGGSSADQRYEALETCAWKTTRGECESVFLQGRDSAGQLEDWNRVGRAEDWQACSWRHVEKSDVIPSPGGVLRSGPLWPSSLLAPLAAGVEEHSHDVSSEALRGQGRAEAESSESEGTDFDSADNEMTCADDEEKATNAEWVPLADPNAELSHKLKGQERLGALSRHSPILSQLERRVHALVDELKRRVASCDARAESGAGALPKAEEARAASIENTDVSTAALNPRFNSRLLTALMAGSEFLGRYSWGRFGSVKVSAELNLTSLAPAANGFGGIDLADPWERTLVLRDGETFSPTDLQWNPKLQLLNLSPAAFGKFQVECAHGALKPVYFSATLTTSHACATGFEDEHGARFVFHEWSRWGQSGMTLGKSVSFCKKHAERFPHLDKENDDEAFRVGVGQTGLERPLVVKKVLFEHNRERGDSPSQHGNGALHAKMLAFAFPQASRDAVQREIGLLGKKEDARPLQSAGPRFADVVARARLSQTNIPKQGVNPRSILLQKQSASPLLGGMALGGVSVSREVKESFLDRQGEGFRDGLFFPNDHVVFAPRATGIGSESELAKGVVVRNLGGEGEHVELTVVWDAVEFGENGEAQEVVFGEEKASLATDPRKRFPTTQRVQRYRESYQEDDTALRSPLAVGTRVQRRLATGLGNSKKKLGIWEHVQGVVTGISEYESEASRGGDGCVKRVNVLWDSDSCTESKYISKADCEQILAFTGVGEEDAFHAPALVVEEDALVDDDGEQKPRISLAQEALREEVAASELKAAWEIRDFRTEEEKARDAGKEEGKKSRNNRDHTIFNCRVPTPEAAQELMGLRVSKRRFHFETGAKKGARRTQFGTVVHAAFKPRQNAFLVKFPAPVSKGLNATATSEPVIEQFTSQDLTPSWHAGLRVWHWKDMKEVAEKLEKRERLGGIWGAKQKAGTIVWTSRPRCWASNAGCDEAPPRFSIPSLEAVRDADGPLVRNMGPTVSELFCKREGEGSSAAAGAAPTHDGGLVSSDSESDSEEGVCTSPKLALVLWDAAGEDDEAAVRALNEDLETEEVACMLEAARPDLMAATCARAVPRASVTLLKQAGELVKEVVKRHDRFDILRVDELGRMEASDKINQLKVELAFKRGS